jgi:hypothetical protein
MSSIRSLTLHEGIVWEVISPVAQLLVASREVRPGISYERGSGQAIEIVEQNEERDHVMAQHAMLMGQFDLVTGSGPDISWL